MSKFKYLLFPDHTYIIKFDADVPYTVEIPGSKILEILKDYYPNSLDNVKELE